MQQLLDELEQNSRASSRSPSPFQPGAGALAGGTVVWGSAGKDGAPIMLGGNRHPFCMIHSSTGAEMNAETLATGHWL